MDVACATHRRWGKSPFSAMNVMPRPRLEPPSTTDDSGTGNVLGLMLYSFKDLVNRCSTTKALSEGGVCFTLSMPLMREGVSACHLLQGNEVRRQVNDTPCMDTADHRSVVIVNAEGGGGERDSRTAAWRCD